MTAYFELLSNVKSLQISLEGSENTAVACDRNSVRMGKHVFSFPFSIMPNTLQVNKGNTLELSVKVNENSSSSNSFTLQIPDELCCGACMVPLADRSRFKSASALPSEYWHELLECWACHHEDYSKLSGQEGGRVLAKSGVIMSGNGYFLIDPKDMIIANIEMKYTGREVCTKHFYDIFSRKLRRYLCLS